MKKNYKLYFITCIALFALAIGLSIFQNNLVDEQAELMLTVGSEKKEKFEKELWAFRTADKLYGWGVTTPRETQEEAFAVMRKVERDTRINAYIVLLIYAVSITLLIIGLLKKRKYKTKLNKTDSQDSLQSP